MDKKAAQKRKRDNEVKKWTEDEIKTILTYMQAHRNIEKPTAQLYYKKLLEATKIDATWNILKCKVRHLKSLLQKANNWSNSTGAGVEDADGVTTIKDKMLKMCPHYEQLSEIFSTSKDIEVVICETSNFDGSFGDLSDIEVIQHDHEFESEDLSASTFTEKAKRKPPTAVEKLAAMEVERNKFREKQMQLENEKFQWMRHFEEKKLGLEEQKIQNDFKIRQLELEQKERMFKLELEFKYKK